MTALAQVGAIPPLNRMTLNTSEYSNAGYMILGLLIQQVSRQPYADYMREHVFVPLQMNQAFLEWMDAQAHGAATGYRVLAGGALSGSVARHVNAARTVDPIATGQSFAEDVKRAQRFDVLVQGGHAGNLIEAAKRFVIGKAGVSTVLIGISDMEQLEQAVEYSTKGPLPAGALGRLRQLWASAGSDREIIETIT
jgi:CubicO group peptidase (beta-lactamase class C family)